MTKQSTAGQQAELEKALAAVQELMELAGPLLSDDTDLSVLKTGHSRYTVPDVLGKNRVFKIPNDVPFTMAVDFLNSFDEWRQARADMADASRAIQQAAHRRQKARGDARMIKRLDREFEAARRTEDARLNAFQTAWPRVVEQLHRMVQLHQPKVVLEEISERTGQTVLEQWVLTVIGKMNEPRLKTLITQAVEAQADPKDPEPTAPRAERRKKARKPSSRSSAA